MDKYCFIIILESMNDELISVDVNLRIFIPLPGVKKTILNCIDEKWIDKHIVKNYLMDN